MSGTARPTSGPPYRLAKQYGTYTHGATPGTVTQPRICLRNSLGDEPTCRLKSRLKVPSELKPTSRQTSVTDREVTVRRC
jgi:hypothetical protein